MTIVRNLFLLLALIPALANLSPAQKPSATPRQEKLLNGMKLLIWNTPASDHVSVKVRIHAGAAFDPQGKEGTMQLLSDSFFPTADAKNFFRDELGGSFGITCNYDYIQIDTTARSADFLTLIETVAQALANPEIDKDSTLALKTALLTKVQAMENDASYVADRAVRKRLFGTFPYGRPVLGNAASLARIDFADLRFAKDRLLTADNATVIVSGSVDPAIAYRAARRYFGAWLKSDKRVPSTFRQPDAPDSSVEKLEMPGVSKPEVRYALRGFARSSKEFAPAEIYARVLQARLAELTSDGSGTDVSVEHDEHVLPGAFIFRYRAQPPAPSNVPPSRVETEDDKNFRSILKRPVADAEFALAKTEVLSAMAKRDLAELWLDVDTFRIGPPTEEVKAFQNVTLADINALSSRLAGEPLAATIVTALGPTPDRTTN